MVEVLQSLRGNFDMQKWIPKYPCLSWGFPAASAGCGEKFQGWKQLKIFYNGVPAQHSLVSLVLRGFKHVFIVKGKCLIQQGPTAFPSRTLAPFLFHKLFGKWTYTLSSSFSQYSLIGLDSGYSLNQLFLFNSHDEWTEPHNIILFPSFRWLEHNEGENFLYLEEF